jgi:hypothetical protein
MHDQRIPHAERGYRTLLLAVASVIETDAYLQMTERQFVGAVLHASGGNVNPARVRLMYAALMSDAGLPPLEVE